MINAPEVSRHKNIDRENLGTNNLMYPILMICMLNILRGNTESIID